MFLPRCAGRLLLSVAKGFIASSPCPASLGGCSLLLPSLEALFRPVVFTCTLCIALVDSLVSRVRSSLAPSYFVPGSWVDLSTCYVRNGLLAGFCDSGLRLRFCTAFRIRLHSSCGYRLLVRSRLRGVFEHKLLFHITLLGLRALFLTGPPFWLRSPSLCDHDVWRLDGCGFRLLAGRDCVPFSSACWRVAFWWCSTVSTSTFLGFSARQFLCSGRFSSTVRIRLWGPSGFSIPVDAALLRTWAFPLVDCSRRVSLSCFPFSVPSSWIAGWSSWLRFAFIELPWGIMLSILPFVGWRLHRVGETFLSGALVPLLCLRRVWFTFCPLPFSWLSRSSSIEAGYVSLRCRALSRPFPRSCPAGLGSLALSWFFWGILDARRTCRVAFPPGGCRSLPSGLARRSVHSLCSWLSVFLSQVTALPPGPCLVWIFWHAPRPPFESLSWVAHGYPSPPSRIVGAKVLDFLCSSVCRLHCTDRPNASKIALGNCWV